MSRTEVQESSAGLRQRVVAQNKTVEKKNDKEGEQIGYTLTRKTVEHHNKKNDAWVIVDGGVYDITMFLESHPGGMDVMEDHLGQDVTELLKDSSSHKHSNYAYKLLDTYRIGTVSDSTGPNDCTDANIDPETGKELVDWTKPVLPQVGNLGDKYEKWVHSFPTADHTVRLFPSDFIESLSKCRWYVPLLYWVPIFAYYLVDLLRNEVDMRVLGIGLVVGFIFWLWFEYCLHRFVFHMQTTGYWANIFHFLIHGHHHITPMDFDRLVFPPAPATIIALPIYFGIPKIFGYYFGNSILIGFGVGYLMYDMTHFWIHHAVPKWGFLKNQKRRHIKHHYFEPNTNFGISNPLFDVVYSTLKE